MKTKQSLNNDELQTNVNLIRNILGMDINTEKVKHYLQGADGNVEIAVNHLLNSLERETSIYTYKNEI